MKILDELRTAKNFDTFTCLTYGVDIAWFESLLLRPLQARGVRRVMILADQARLSSSLDAATEIVGGMGRIYLLHGIQSRVTFHPKLYLLSGERAARLYVGSGNLGRGGLDRNREVFERWDADGDGNSPLAFDEARRYIETLLQPFAVGDPVELEHLDHAFRFARHGSGGAAEASLLASPPALLEQIPFGEAPCDRLRMVAPFFDENGDAVRRIVERVRPPTFEVIFHPRMTNITRRAVQAIEALGGKVLKVDSDGAKTNDRPVHGKLLYARAHEWRLGVVGSANLSIAAWSGHNHELVAVRTGADADVVDALIEELPCTALNEKDLSKLDQLEEKRRLEREQSGEPSDALRQNAIRCAKWSRSDRILVLLAHETSEAPELELRTESTTTREETAVRVEDGWQVRVPPAVRRGMPCLVRVKGDPPWPWVVVQDPAELRAFARARGGEREALDRLLDASELDIDGAIKLMELFASIQQGRLESDERERQGSRSESNGGADSPELRWVSRQDFAAARPSSVGPNPSSLVPLVSVGLMNRLLFGDDVYDDHGSDSWEPEPSGDDDGLGADLDDDETLERAGRIASRRYVEPVPEKLAAFLAASRRARESYLQTLHNRPSDPYQLLDQLMVLTAPLHYMLGAGGMGDQEFRAEMVPLLGAMVGSPRSLLIQAIDRLDADARGELWEHTPTFVMVMLLVYNACVADAHVSMRRHPELRVTVEFERSHPVLWLRHVVRLTTPEQRHELLCVLPTLGPRLRTGIFWLGRVWPRQVAQAPFEEFVRRAIDEAITLDRVEDQLRRFAGKVRELDRGRTLEVDDEVVYLGNVGAMGAGWVEEEDRSDRLAVQVRSGAFEDPPDAGRRGESYARRTQSPSTAEVLRLEAILTLAVEEEDTLDVDMDGLAVLARIAGS